ncbi:MAG TPA: DUF4153 domain-containing protein [Sphingobium sp.]|nr:DUF4153 domain-containing protein [Sphingobium sp.]
MDAQTDTGEEAWPLRSWALAALGLVLALAIQQLTALPDSDWIWGERLVRSAVLLLGVGGIAFGLGWQRGRLAPAIAAALLCGGVAGGALLWNGLLADWSFNWRLLCGLVTAGVLLVLFQSAQARHPYLPETWSRAGLALWGRRALAYADVHATIWTDAILLGGAALFTLATFLVAQLLAAMFALVKIEALRDLLAKDWFMAMMLGAAFGGALGLLRERARIIAAVQGVAMLVLRILAPVLAVGLAAFLAVLPFTGLAPLWATGNTTPLMLSAALAALFLVNAVIGARDEPLARPLRWAALVLALLLLPLVLIAAWSTGLRIDQRGLSPDRLWALTFIVLGTVTAVAHVVAVAGRGDWIARLHRSNLHLAFVLGGVALILSTPLVSFERIATADQVARLQAGRIAPLDFDYRALWFDFGPPGKAAIKRLARTAKSPEARRFAAAIQKQTNRWEDAPNQRARQAGEALDARLTILPRAVPLEPALRERLVAYDACRPQGGCVLRYAPGADHAVGVALPQVSCRGCRPVLFLLYRTAEGRWEGGAPGPDRGAQEAVDPGVADALRAGRVELRTVERRQLFVDGKPFGATIPPENATQP